VPKKLLAALTPTNMLLTYIESGTEEVEKKRQSTAIGFDFAS
jgi:hypothetical protein